MTCVGMLSRSVSRVGGGVSAVMQILSQDLTRDGVNVKVFGGRDEQSEADLPGWGNIPVSLHSRIGPSGLGIQRGLNGALLSSGLDLIHLHGLWVYPSVAALFAGRHGLPRVISPHGMLDPWALRNAGWKKRIALSLFEERNLEGANLIHALNNNERDAIRSIGITTPIVVVPNGVSLPEVSSRQTLPDWLHKDGRRILLFLGRIHPKKGLHETIAAWHLTLKSRPNLSETWQLVIAGWDDGNHVKALKNYAIELGISPHVHFIGPIFGADKDTLLASAGAFILASHSEGLPMAVLEAWSHSLPVFMTQECNLQEGFVEGAALQLSHSPLEIARVLGEALSLPETELAGLGSKGRALVISHYSRERVSEMMLKAYEWVLGGGVRPQDIEVTYG